MDDNQYLKELSSQLRELIVTIDTLNELQARCYKRKESIENKMLELESAKK